MLAPFACTAKRTCACVAFIASVPCQRRRMVLRIEEENRGRQLVHAIEFFEPQTWMQTANNTATRHGKHKCRTLAKECCRQKSPASRKSLCRCCIQPSQRQRYTKHYALRVSSAMHTLHKCGYGGRVHGHVMNM